MKKGNENRICKHTTKQWVKWYGQKESILQEKYQRVTPEEFYRALFPEGSFEPRGSYTPGCGNGMIDIIKYYKLRNGEEKSYSRKYVLTDELDGLKYALTNQSHADSRLCLCSPVSYFGEHKSNAMAHEIYAIVLDIDYVGPLQLKNMIKQIGNGARTIPPNYLVNSGRGFHLYYLLKEPIPCYHYMVEQLTQFKSVMQDFTWNETSSLKPDKPDHGACTQAFRMVGTETKLGQDYIVTAYKVRDERWTVEELYNWIKVKSPLHVKNVALPMLREPIEVYRKEHPLTLAEAKAKYPNWTPGGRVKKWTCKDDLYYWWVDQIKKKAVVGGRYYCILALAAYGSKCDIPADQVYEDAMGLLPILEEITDDELNHFTEKDINDALKFYRENQENVTYKLTRQKISELSKIEIKPNKRNGRKLRPHIQMVNSTRKFRRDILGEDEYKNNGRPDKSEIVKKWRREHPDGRKVECVKETGLSKPTVIRWWDGDDKKNDSAEYKIAKPANPDPEKGQGVVDQDLMAALLEQVSKMSAADRELLMKTLQNNN